MLPSFLKKRGILQPAWRFTPEGVIWRILLASAGRVVGESRNLETKRVSFFCVDTTTGKPLWKGVSFGEQWWMGIEAVCGETMFLHKYATPSLPEHKSIIAVDAQSGRVLWANEDLKFEFIADDSLIASRSTVLGARYCQIDVHDGSLRRELAEAEALALRQVPSSNEVEDVGTPRPLFDLAEDVSEQAAAIRSHCDAGKLVGPVEFLEHNSMLIFDYYERGISASEDRPSREPLINTLKILDRRSGTLLFENRMNTDSLSVVPGSFCVRNNMLMYIRERMTLTAIDLTVTKMQ